MPYFSVVIPLYNKENFIAATLKSVLAQTFTEFEVIVVNDASTDDSLTKAKEIKDPRVRIIDHGVNKGLSASRNTGIKNAQSDYIAFLDADDTWKREFLEKIYELIGLYPQAGIYASKYEEVRPGGVIIPVEGPKSGKRTGIINFFSENVGQLKLNSSSICVRKNVFDVSGYYDESITFAEDIDFYIRAFYNYQLAYCNEVLVQYLIHSSIQMSQAGLSNKTIPDLDKYEPLASGRKDIKKFLDFYRYFMAKEYKIAGDRDSYAKTLKNLDARSLNHKQRMLLMCPTSLLKLIKKIKSILIKRGINPTTY